MLLLKLNMRICEGGVAAQKTRHLQRTRTGTYIVPVPTTGEWLCVCVGVRVCECEFETKRKLFRNWFWCWFWIDSFELAFCWVEVEVLSLALNDSIVEFVKNFFRFYCRMPRLKLIPFQLRRMCVAAKRPIMIQATAVSSCVSVLSVSRFTIILQRHEMELTFLCISSFHQLSVWVQWSTSDSKSVHSSKSHSLRHATRFCAV